MSAAVIVTHRAAAAFAAAASISRPRSGRARGGRGRAALTTQLCRGNDLGIERRGALGDGRHRAVGRCVTGLGLGSDDEEMRTRDEGVASVVERVDADAEGGPSDELGFDLTLASTALMATFAVAFFAATEPASAADVANSVEGTVPTHELWTLAGGEVPFWANMVKYARFSISIMVGFAFMFGRPIVNLLKKPQTAILVIGGGYGGYRFFKFTIETMLGMNDPDTLNYTMGH